MATYLTVDKVVDRITGVEHELSSGEESEYEGDGIASYLPGSLDGPMDFRTGTREPQDSVEELDGDAGSLGPSSDHSPGNCTFR